MWNKVLLRPAAGGGDVSSLERDDDDMSSVVKLGTWGGDAGSACDLTVAPQRLESVTIRWGKVIDWISFSYRDRDGRPHTAGPWGGNGKGEGTETMTLEPTEYVTGVEWSVGPFTFKNVERCITCVKLVTNLRSFGPFGHGVDSTHHNLPVLGNASVVGMFARAGDFLDAIGFYILPAAVVLPAAVKPTAEDPNNNQEAEKENNKDSSQEEEEEEKCSQEEKEEDSSQEEKEEEEKSNNQEEKEKGDSSSHEEKENGKS